MRRLALLAWLLAATPALAATPIARSTPHGVMMQQVLHTLGAWEVACPDLAATRAGAHEQRSCAQVPGSMYGFFREAVHGRLYEYLARHTLTVSHAWSSATGPLTVAYAVDGGTFTIARVRVGNVIYAVFRFVAPVQRVRMSPQARSALQRAAAPPPGSP